MITDDHTVSQQQQHGPPLGCTLQSGGAVGADISFATCARKAGHRVQHFVFEKQYVYTPQDLIRLTPSDLKQADVFVNDASIILQRPVGNEYQYNLLRRNYFQIRNASSVFVVSNFEFVVSNNNNNNSNTPPRRNVGIVGGSAWACQMFVNEYYKTHSKQLLSSSVHPIAMPLYCFDQISEHWFQCRIRDLTGSIEWVQLGQRPQLPTTGVYAGIGSRQLTPAGQHAIESLYRAVT
jgi:hypothetical protein